MGSHDHEDTTCSTAVSRLWGYKQQWLGKWATHHNTLK